MEKVHNWRKFRLAFFIRLFEHFTKIIMNSQDDAKYTMDLNILRSFNFIFFDQFDE